uniref:Putative striated muscle preferentially n=1 Tax=Panstrongylus lignarius TaxID=156445 RepID=A0A224XLL5_9HEMI
MAPKREKGALQATSLSSALSLAAFTRLISGTKTALNRHLDAFLQRKKDAAVTTSLTVTLRDLTNADFAAFLRRAEAYLDANPLPEGISDELLLDEIQQVRDLYQQIICIFAETSPAPSATTLSHISATRLPQIPVPHFDGDFRQWVSFRDTFTALVVNQPDISDVERLHYLLNALRGEARATIQHISLSEGQFQVAWATLRQAYDNKRRLAELLLHQLLEMPTLPASPSVEQMQEVLSKGVSCAEALLEIQAPNLASFMAFALLARHLDSETRKQFETAHVDVEFPTLAHLKTFLRNSIHALRLTPPLRRAAPSQRGTSHASRAIPRPSTSSRSPPLAFTASTTPSSPLSASSLNPASPAQGTYICEFCQGGHSIRQCLGFKALSVPDRRKYISLAKLCHNCLSATHRTPNCRSIHRCHFCSQAHHTLVHMAQSDAMRTTNLPPSAPLPTLEKATSSSPPASLRTPTSPTSEEPRPPLSPRYTSWAECPSPPPSPPLSPRQRDVAPSATRGRIRVRTYPSEQI